MARRYVVEVARPGRDGGTIPADADPALTANSDGAVPTQKAVKTFVDTRIPVAGTLGQVLISDGGDAYWADLVVDGGTY